MTKAAALGGRSPVDGRLAAIGRQIGRVATNRFLVAVFGTTAVAGAHAVLQFAVLRAMPQPVFGLFAFMLGLTQFGFGLSNALVGTPYTLDVSAGRPSSGSLYGKVNLVLSGLSGVVAAAIAGQLGGDSLLFGCFATLALLRWFGRSHLYALHRPGLVAVSDTIYALVLLVGAGLILGIGLPDNAAVGVLCCAAFAGLAALGRPFLTMQFIQAWHGSPRGYGMVWRDQARWTLVGVVSSEATANAHAYTVSLLAGPAAFAPIAAASLLIKPIMLVITSLTQLERPIMARSLLAGREAEALRSTKMFRIVVLGTWFATTALASIVLFRFPEILVKPLYDLRTLEVAFALWSGIALLQCWSTPPSVLLQAAQQLKPLALTQTRAAVAALAAVLGLAFVLPPVFTLCGILAGQLIMAGRISHLAKNWRLRPRQVSATC